MFVARMSLASRQYEQSLRQAMEQGGGSLPAEFTYYGTHWDDAVQEPAIYAALERNGLRAGSPHRHPGWFSHHGRNHLSLRPTARVERAQGSFDYHDGRRRRREGVIARSLTTVAINAAALGRRAAELLYEMQAGQRAIDDTEQIFMPIELQKGKTLDRCSD